jgi:hypothetical protein
MKRSIIVLMAAAFAVFAFAGTSMASTAAGGTFKDGPYTATTTDSGTCGNNWAQDLFLRNFVVQLPAVGSVYTVTEKFQKGRFSSYPGPSPASCDTGPGDTIKSGIVGKFSGTFTMSVSGTFNDSGSCDLTTYGTGSGSWTQCDTAGWVTGFFGAGATYSVGQFSFSYHAGGEGLDYHDWTNADTGNSGDIGNAP